MEKSTFVQKNRARKMLMKLRPCVNFTNVLHTAFTTVAPQSIRTQSICQYLFTLLGSTCVKAVRRTLMKLRPCRFIFRNVLKIYRSEEIRSVFMRFAYLSPIVVVFVAAVVVYLLLFLKFFCCC